jgi:long-subunit fatty acid transport protein
MTMDVSYSLRLADQFSMGVSLRYLRSDLKISQVDDTAIAASNSVVVTKNKSKITNNEYNDFIDNECIDSCTFENNNIDQDR